MKLGNKLADESRRPSINELMADHTLTSAAVHRAMREAVLQHARAGKPVATCRDGKVVWIPPEEILAQFNTEPPP